MNKLRAGFTVEELAKAAAIINKLGINMIDILGVNKMTEQELVIKELILLRHVFKYATAMGTPVGTFLHSREARIVALDYAINNIREFDEEKVKKILKEHFNTIVVCKPFPWRYKEVLTDLAHEIVTKDIRKEIK